MTNVSIKHKKSEKEKLKEIIDKNLTGTKSVDVYLVNGIKMSAYIMEVIPGHYMLLDRLNGDSAAHMVFWDTIVTITKSTDKRVDKKEENHKIVLEQEIDKREKENVNIFLNKNLFIYLSNGIKLDGTCLDIEEGGYIILEKNSNEQIILWHAIATISIIAGTETVNINNECKNNVFLAQLLKKQVAIFLKGGIKLRGILTDFTNNENNEWQFVLDNQQLVRAEHVSTITEFRE